MLISLSGSPLDVANPPVPFRNFAVGESTPPADRNAAPAGFDEIMSVHETAQGIGRTISQGPARELARLLARITASERTSLTGLEPEMRRVQDRAASIPVAYDFRKLRLRDSLDELRLQFATEWRSPRRR